MANDFSALAEALEALTREQGTNPVPRSEGGAATADAAHLQGAAARVESQLLAPAQRIFVNRNLRFDHIRQVGFDLDYTLAIYRKRNIEDLSFRMTVDKLVEKLGYPEEVRALPYDPSFVVRGLVVDKRLGNIFKMDQHNHVGRGYHGRRAITKDQRYKYYRKSKIRLSATRYHWIDTLFALPEAALYAAIIDLFELTLKQKRIDYWKLFDDIRSSIDECHRDGSLKAVIKANVDHYIEADPDLPQTLHKLRSAGKRTFLLTNSFWDYTNAVMHHILHDKLPEYPSWKNYFDLIIVGAQKPTFFTNDDPFLEINEETGESIGVPHRFERGRIYQGGSFAQLETILKDEGEQVLYVGDHIYGDIIRSKRDSLWRTALVLEELEQELQLAHELHRAQSDLVAVEEQRVLLDDEVTSLKLRISALEQAIDDHGAEQTPEWTELHRLRKQLRALLDKKKKDLKTLIAKRDDLEAEVDRAYNPYWGSVFREGTDSSRFGGQVEDYACVYTARVSNFLHYSPKQYFRAPRHWMAHEKI